MRTSSFKLLHCLIRSLWWTVTKLTTDKSLFALIMTRVLNWWKLHKVRTYLLTSTVNGSKLLRLKSRMQGTIKSSNSSNNYGVNIYINLFPVLYSYCKVLFSSDYVMMSESNKHELCVWECVPCSLVVTLLDCRIGFKSLPRQNFRCFEMYALLGLCYKHPCFRS